MAHAPGAAQPSPQAAAALDLAPGTLRARAGRTGRGWAHGVRAAPEPASLPPRGQRRRRR